MNLWQDLNQENGITVKPSPATRRSLRRISERAIFSILREWLLHDYVVPYCQALGATHIYRRCYWIDGLGSLSTPSTALEAIAAVSQELAAGQPKPVTLRGFLLDAGNGKRKEVQEITLPEQSGIIKTGWQSAAPLIFKELDQSPGIFLLAPLGQPLFTPEELALLYQRTAPTELCLLISHKQLEARVLSAQNSPAEASALTTLLRSDRWKTFQIQSGETQGTPIQAILDLFIATMQKHFLAVKSLGLPVLSRPAVVEMAPYTLIFATRRQDSLARMNDAYCLYVRRLEEQSHTGILGEDWFRTQLQNRFSEAFEELYQRAIRLGQSQKPRRWPDLRQQLLLPAFGRFTLAEYDQIIQRLLTDARVRCEWRRQPREGEIQQPLIPGNEDTLFWK